MHEITADLYKDFLKPLLFKQDPEKVHDNFTKVGAFLGKYISTRDLVAFMYDVKDSSLETEINGLELKNPVGLSAGFDYNGSMAALLPSFSFGFNTVGTVTAQEYEGNKTPRLLRLPKSQSLLVNKGFKSLGVDKVEEILDSHEYPYEKGRGAMGVSVGSTNIDEVNTIAKAIDDYIHTFEKLKDKDYIKYFEINISCPNTKMPESFAEVKNLEMLLKEIDSLKINKPLFIKLANEVEESLLGKQLETCLKYNVNTAILSNLVKKRDNPGFDRVEIEEMKGFKGNFSGKPCEKNSNNLIKFAYKNFAPELKVIGVGGIFSADNAYEKIKLGASAVQLITGMIYKGPQLMGQINKGIVNRLKEDGFENISEAVGSGA